MKWKLVRYLFKAFSLFLGASRCFPHSLHSLQPARVPSLFLLVSITALESEITPPLKYDGELCLHTSTSICALMENTWKQHHNLKEFASVLQTFSKVPLCARPGDGDRGG